MIKKLKNQTSKKLEEHSKIPKIIIGNSEALAKKLDKKRMTEIEYLIFGNEYIFL